MIGAIRKDGHHVAIADPAPPFFIDERRRERGQRQQRARRRAAPHTPARRRPALPPSAISSPALTNPATAILSASIPPVDGRHPHLLPPSITPKASRSCSHDPSMTHQSSGEQQHASTGRSATASDGQHLRVLTHPIHGHDRPISSAILTSTKPANEIPCPNPASPPPIFVRDPAMLDAHVPSHHNPTSQRASVPTIPRASHQSISPALMAVKEKKINWKVVISWQTINSGQC
ncbi:hypothetical protein ACLOJK_033530 [Asimina triloba]